MTLDELHEAYKNTLASWRTWDCGRKSAQLAQLNGLASTASDLGDPDLADDFDELSEVMAAHIERTPVIL